MSGVRLGKVAHMLHTTDLPQYQILTACRNSAQNATNFQRQFLLATGRTVLSQADRNKIHQGGIYAHKVYDVYSYDLNTPCGSKKFGCWTSPSRWTQRDNSKVLFTDYSLQCDTRSVFICAKRDTLNTPTFAQERSKSDEVDWWYGVEST